MPAVSMSLKIIPFIFTLSSIKSLVVPGMALTMALSSFNNKLSKLDFPTLVLPTIAV